MRAEEKDTWVGKGLRGARANFSQETQRKTLCGRALQAEGTEVGEHRMFPRW